MTDIIDAWMQHPTPRLLSQPFLAPLLRWTGQSANGLTLPLSQTLADMDAGGIRLGLISAWYGPGGPLISNDEVAAVMAEAPDRFAGIGGADISRPMEAVAEIRRCVKQLGFKGIRIIQWLWRLPPTHRWYAPVFAECCELGVPVCLQVGHTGPLMPSETGRPIPYIDEIAIDFPELTIVGGHIGYPWTEEMVAVCTKHPNVYIDTSAYTAARYPAELVRYMKAHGAGKVMFGTNYPMIAPAKALERLDDLDLDSQTRELFLHGNAERVFRL